VGWVTVAGDPLSEGQALDEFIKSYTQRLAKTVPGYREARRAPTPMLGLSDGCLLEFEAHPNKDATSTHLHGIAVHEGRSYVVGATLPTEGRAEAGRALAQLLATITVRAAE
jgi:hypothetical protein